MGPVYQKITITESSKPVNKGINEELQWFGSSLGLFSLRDKNKSCFRIFIELLKTSKKGKSLSSDEIADRLNLTRGTIIHHINKLMESGIVVNKKNRYMLRINSLSVLIREVEKDFKKTYDDLKEVAEHIDKELRL